MRNKNNRINQILNNYKFRKYIEMNNECEIDRKFCRHNIEHSIDVARIAYIINLEKELGFNKDIIYGIALLHDIGRWQQYAEGIEHNILSAVLANDILIESGYSEDEIVIIKEAIVSHNKLDLVDDSLNQIIYIADKKSRTCFFCKAQNECKWEMDKRNISLDY